MSELLGKFGVWGSRYQWADRVDEVAAPGSDRLIDALVAHGSPEQVAAKLRAHVDAGADHVAIQSLNGRYAELAEALRLKA